MKHLLILSLLLFFGVAQCEASTTKVLGPLQPLTPALSPQWQDTMASNPFGDNYNNSVLEKIEQSLFGKAYANQNINSRLSRIERALFTITYPNSTNSQRIDNIISNFNQINKNPNISRNDLSRLESKILGSQFAQNNPQRRIERLEEQLFGAVQSGDLDSRLKSIKLAAKNKNINQDEFNQEDMMSDYNSTGFNNFSNGGWKNILGNWAMGSMTGFSPSINPYNQFASSQPYGPQTRTYNRYGAYNARNPYMSRHGIQEDVRSNYGYSSGYKDYGSGAAVTILD